MAKTHFRRDPRNEIPLRNDLGCGCPVSGAMSGTPHALQPRTNRVHSPAERSNHMERLLLAFLRKTPMSGIVWQSAGGQLWAASIEGRTRGSGKQPEARMGDARTCVAGFGLTEL